MNTIETERVRGGAKVVSARKIAQRYVKDNVDVSQVADDDVDYVLQICADIQEWSDRSDLYFKVRDDNVEYNIGVTGMPIVDHVACVKKFHMADAKALYQNILGSSSNCDARQMEFRVKKRGVISSMEEQRRRRQEKMEANAYVTTGTYKTPSRVHRATRVPVAQMTPRTSVRPSGRIGKQRRQPNQRNIRGSGRPLPRRSPRNSQRHL